MFPNLCELSNWLPVLLVAPSANQDLTGSQARGFGKLWKEYEFLRLTRHLNRQVCHLGTDRSQAWLASLSEPRMSTKSHEFQCKQFLYSCFFVSISGSKDFVLRASHLVFRYQLANYAAAATTLFIRLIMIIYVHNNLTEAIQLDARLTISGSELNEHSGLVQMVRFQPAL